VADTNSPVAIGFACHVCGVREIAKPHAIRATYKRFQEHLNAYHSDAKTNLEGQQIEKLSDEVRSKLLYTSEDMQSFMAST
jgi:hypothetical protein